MRNLHFALIFMLTTLASQSALAFRMIANSAEGRLTAGQQVLCSNPSGFAHWSTQNITWRLHSGNAFAATPMRNAMQSWSGVSGSNYSLDWGGTTSNDSFATDGVNVVNWGANQGCSGNCLALTALVIVGDQTIIESDITFNNSRPWNTNGADYDIESVMAHELGHSLGIHHTEVSSGILPTMKTPYFGTAAKTLSFDDMNALRCSQEKYFGPAGGAGVSWTASCKSKITGYVYGGHPQYWVTGSATSSAGAVIDYRSAINSNNFGPWRSYPGNGANIVGPFLVGVYGQASSYNIKVGFRDGAGNTRTTQCSVP